MDSRQLLAEARDAGIGVRAEDDQLLVDTPRRSLALAEELGRHKWDILAVLAAEDPEVEWRVQAMRGSGGEHRPNSFLTVRDVPRGGGACMSCGEPLHATGEGFIVRCTPCRHAAWLVTTQQAEGHSGP